MKRLIFILALFVGLASYAQDRIVPVGDDYLERVDAIAFNYDRFGGKLLAFYVTDWGAEFDLVILDENGNVVKNATLVSDPRTYKHDVVRIKKGKLKVGTYFAKFVQMEVNGLIYYLGDVPADKFTVYPRK